LGIVNPIYLFVNYVFSPVEAFKATDMRLTSTKYTKGILPMMVLWHYLPVLLMYSWPTFLGQASWHLFWKINPLLISVSLLLISRCFADTTMQDRVHNPLCDLPTIYSTLGLTTALSAAARVRNFAQGSILPSNMWALATASRHDDICIFTDAVINEALLSLSVFMWLGYLLWDLKHSGMIQAGYLKIILCLGVAILSLGPGVAVGCAWIWRETIIAHNRHKFAITEKEAPGMSITCRT
jgi:hypothetical protein